MKQLTLLLAILLTASLSEAQNRLRIAMDTKPVGSTIRISKYLGDMTIPLDSVRYRGEPEVTFVYDDRYTDGVYVLDVATLESFQFMQIGQKDLNAHIYESGSGMAFKPDLSPENDAFNIMLNLSEVYSKSMDTLSFSLSNLSDFDPRHDAKTDSLAAVYHRIADAYNNSLSLLKNLFPDSYTANVLINLDKIPLRTQTKEWQAQFDNDAAFNHEHYFHFIDFADERIITNPFLADKVLEYMYNYTERSEVGIKKTIDKLLKQENINPKVESFLLDLLVDFFTEKEAPEFVDYLDREYLGNCELPLSEETLARIGSMVKFKVGEAVPALRLPNQAGHQVPLSASTGQLNVIVFWASTCPHCMREIPKLKEIFDEMGGNLGVYAISVDESKEEWITTVNEYKLRWINVHEPDGWESKNLEAFGITSTPSLILIDNEFKWIGRASSFDGLHQLVKEQLVD